MPILGTSLPNAARQFCEHFNRVLSTTISHAHLTSIHIPGSPWAVITFRTQGEVDTATLPTAYGRLYLSLHQSCGSTIEVDGRHRLRTEKYRYALSAAPEEEPLFRWEYERVPSPGNRHPRHHAHFDTTIDINGHSLSLQGLHVCTGYLPFEELIRFCIVELGVRPLQEDWETVLEESYRLFRTDFAR